MDSFLDKVKNRLTWILKNYDFNIPSTWKFIKVQLEILSEYLNISSSRISVIYVIFELSEILLILKKNFIEYISKIGPFEISKNDIKLLEKSDYSEYRVPDEFLSLFSSFMNVLHRIISGSNLSRFILKIVTCNKFINETFMICPSFLEILKFLIGNLFTRDITDKYESGRVSTSNRPSSPTKKTNPKFTLVNFIKDIDLKITESNQILKDQLYENYKDLLTYTLSIINYLYSSSIFYHKIVRQENLDKAGKISIKNIDNEDKEASRYWVNSIRDYLKFVYGFVNSKNGLFFDYLTTYGSYIKIKNPHAEMNNIITASKSNTMVNFCLTRAILYLQYSVLSFSSKFSLIVNEITSLDMIRIHYISFIKLYNKNLDFRTKLGDVNKIFEDCSSTDKKRKIKALIRDIYNDQNFLQVVILLCRIHLQCLFALAKNRNFDVTNKFFQLRIVDFMTKELDLEHEAAEKIHKYKSTQSKKNIVSPNIKEDHISDFHEDLNNIENNFALNSSNVAGNKKLINMKSININTDKTSKEEIVRNKYKSEHQIVMEVKEEDISKNSKTSCKFFIKTSIQK